MMFVASGGIAAVAGGYFGVKFYKKRQQQVVDEFGRMMMFYVGDDQLTNDCVKEYKGKVGPLINGFHKKDMFKSYAMRLAADKPLGPLTLEHFAGMAKKLGVKPAKAIQQAALELVPYSDPTETWERNANKPSVLGKLLWLTERCYYDEATVTAIRKRYPKSTVEFIDVLQNTLTEEAYKSIVGKAGGPDAGVQPGYAEIGMTEADAQGLINRWLDEARTKADEAAALAEEKAGQAKIIAIREAAIAGQAEKANLNDGRVKTHGEVEKPKVESKIDPDAPHEYECTQCGFTLFVAKGREFKFFGDNFKCGTCGPARSFSRIIRSRACKT